MVPQGLSVERVEKTQYAILRALGLQDMSGSDLARMRLRQDQVERVERSISRAIASGEAETRSGRLLQFLVALDRLASDLPDASNLKRTILSMRKSLLDRFPEESKTAGPLADSIAEIAETPVPSPTPGTETVKILPAVAPSESRRATARTVRRE
ncbi:MAG TPA: hypothetical protein PK765_00575 [bacterium]|nr:hypothetical protein [bacterium]